MLGLGAYAMFHLPQYAEQVAAINVKLATVSDPATQEQVRFALLLAKILPAGLFGLFAIMLLAGTISGDASYLHSWGTMTEFLAFAIVTFVLAPLIHFSDLFWEEYQFWRNVPFYAVIGTVSTLWIVGGGIRDAVNLVKDLRDYKADERDDGFVE